ncbi:MAG: hypothetical protein J1F42_12295 [Lachnospiraceae bacterium]|nr:hypothetical protein [Lachnospiraceae bacterium]
MVKRIRHTLKYIFLTGILCTCMTACGNVDSQSVVEQSETEIIQEPSEEIPILGPESTPEPEASPEPESAQEPEEVIDNTQANTEKFYQTAEEDYGLSHEEAQNWFDIITKDGIFDGGVREISGLIFEDIDGNGMTDMVIMVQETEKKYMYGTGALYFYINEEEAYCFTDEDCYFYFPMYICYADLNGDGNAEIAFATQGTGVGAVGDWYKAVFSYTGSTMERLEIPSDLDSDYEEGISVEVIMEPEPDTYTAFCPYFDESITFQAPNIYEGDEQKEHLAQAPKKVGGNIRGYCGLQIVTWEGRNALQAIEYLSGEGGTGHFVGWACFILVWDEQGNGSVADWWVEERTS